MTEDEARLARIKVKREAEFAARPKTSRIPTQRSPPAECANPGGFYHRVHECHVLGHRGCTAGQCTRDRCPACHKDIMAAQAKSNTDLNRMTNHFIVNQQGLTWGGTDPRRPSEPIPAAKSLVLGTQKVGAAIVRAIAPTIRKKNEDS